MDTKVNNLEFDLPRFRSNVIKVIGVGGGGSNAINHMFNQGIEGVDFVICNTDAQALENSPVPTKIQLGVTLTEGLGAGANPMVGEQAAIENKEEIEAILGSNTKMVFITAGMGGGTGTGAAPIIAKMAKDLGILTVGIVTSPFQFEGNVRNKQAQEGVERMRKSVDSLIVINNNKLRDVYGNLGFKAGFSKADEVLSIAAKGIAEVITKHYLQNIDLRDAKTVLTDSGTAIMGSASASGTHRAKEAVTKALDSPLLNDNKITGAKNVLLLIVSGTKEITLDEIGEITQHIQNEAHNNANIIYGVGEDTSKDDEVSVTVIATGFDYEQQRSINNTEEKKVIHVLGEEQSAKLDLSDTSDSFRIQSPHEEKVLNVIDEPIQQEPVKVHTLFDLEEEDTFDGYIKTTAFIKNIEVKDKLISEEVANQEPVVEQFEIQQEMVQIHQIPETEFVIYDKSEELEEETPEPQEELLNFNFTVETEEPKTSPSPESITPSEPVATQTSEVKRYTLDFDVEEDEADVKMEVQTLELEEEEKDESLIFEIKTSQAIETPVEEEVLEEELDPLNSPISQALRSRTEERKRTLKNFNYKFREGISKSFNKIENEPAYKRQGISLDTEDSDASFSRTTLNTSEDDLEFRTNNSFLHDNVD